MNGFSNYALLLRTTHSHLYPGSTLTLGHDAPRNAKPHPAVIEFADGSGATATLSRVDDDALELAVDAYVTQKRHKVVARRWLLRPADAHTYGMACRRTAGRRLTFTPANRYPRSICPAMIIRLASVACSFQKR